MNPGLKTGTMRQVAIPHSAAVTIEEGAGFTSGK
jgi:hypothetical protein